MWPEYYDLSPDDPFFDGLFLDLLLEYCPENLDEDDEAMRMGHEYAGQQHLQFGKEDGKETVRIKSSRKAFFLQTDSGTEISVFTKSKSSLAQNVQIKWR